MKRNEIWLFVILMACLIPLELIAAWLAYETIGEIMQGFYFMAVGLGFLVAILLSFKSRLAAAVVAVLVFLAIVPYQFFLVHRQVRTQAEVTRIVSYAHRHKAKTGRFPADLSGYEFADPSVKHLISFSVSQKDTKKDTESFAVYYHIGTENTSHSFSPDDGWFYYPD